MTRKDTIVIAVLINMGLLALLFATAVVIEEPEKPLFSPVKEQPPLAQASSRIEKKNVPIETPPTLEPLFAHVYTTPSPAANSPFPEMPLVQREERAEKVVQVLSPPEPASRSSTEETVTMTVQEGDRLEKIARKYGTTVSAIKKANQLSSEKIRVGQQLRIPKKKEETALVETLPSSKKETKEGAEYYVIKSGDNPWTIAKQCNVRYNDILRLNHIDDEKAKNLRPGEKIRVR